MKHILGFFLVLALSFFISTSAFADHDATGASSGTHSSTGAAAGTSATGSTSGSTGGTPDSTTYPVIAVPVKVEVEVETEHGVQTTTVKPDSSSSPLCGGKEMPKLECPAGYSVSCNTAVSQWACLKSSSGASAGASAGSGGAGAGKVIMNDFRDADDDGDGVLTILEDSAVKAAVFIKIDGVKGESNDGKSKGGNVEFEWKVEEGESSAAHDMFLKFPPIEGDTESGEKGGTEDINIGVGEFQSKTIVVNAVSVRGWDPKTKQEIADAAPKTAADVKSEAGLALFAAVQAENDAQMEEVSFNYGKIIVKYGNEGRLFGFIPHKFTQEVSVENDAVTVKLPWYSFLMSGYVTAEDLATEAAKKGKDHKNEIEILSWSFGANNAAAAQGGVRVAVGDVNGDGRASAPEDFADAFVQVSSVLKASYDLAVQKKI